ncbi:MAG: homoserine kinase [Wenzhouxiangella sp.]|nr:MAG: homoserine kinase [Wenzhouxiangella sp.]
MTTTPDKAVAFAPASVGNVAVGFDLLGHAIEGPGDTVTARRSEHAGVRISAIEGVVRDLPLDSERNTAGRAVMALLEARQPGFGVELVINKGIPLSSGLGGSAASAVAALVASNALLDEPLEHEALYPFALVGEAIASGASHGDNVGPQLLGGLVLATADRLISIPVPEGLLAVVVHPDCQVETRRARESLAQPFDINTIVAQSSHLAQFLAGCYSNDLDLVAAGLADVLVEPRRAHLIPGFAAVKQAALAHGALGASISGAGPSVFGWFTQPASAQNAARAMQAAFAAVNLDSQAWITPVQAPGARLLAS